MTSLLELYPSSQCQKLQHKLWNLTGPSTFGTEVDFVWTATEQECAVLLSIVRDWEMRPVSNRGHGTVCQNMAGAFALYSHCHLSSTSTACLSTEGRTDPYQQASASKGSSYFPLLNQAKRNILRDENIFFAILLSTELHHRLTTDLHFPTAGYRHKIHLGQN